MIGLLFREVWATINCCFSHLPGFIYTSNRIWGSIQCIGSILRPLSSFSSVTRTHLVTAYPLLWNNTLPSFPARKRTFLSNVGLTAPRLIGQLSYNSSLNYYSKSNHPEFHSQIISYSFLIFHTHKRMVYLQYFKVESNRFPLLLFSVWQYVTIIDPIISHLSESEMS